MTTPDPPRDSISRRPRRSASPRPKPWSKAELALPARATLLAYTDGVIERRDQVIDEGIERLESAFASADPELAAGELADKLIHEVAEVTAADDDVALVVMRFLGSPVACPSRTAPATWRPGQSGRLVRRGRAACSAQLRDADRAMAGEAG